MSAPSIGIDVGGTFVDVVLVDDDVIWFSKFPSLSPDFNERLTEELRRATEALRSTRSESEVSQICLCTTLATNALANGNFRAALLVLIGYPQGVTDDVAAETRDMPDLKIAHIRGGHDRNGDEKKTLDEAGLTNLAGRYADSVEGIGISSFYSTRNPAHEIMAQKILGESSGVACVCGSELSSDLNAVRRAVTCALNASLIPIAKDMIGMVRRSVESAGLDAPLFVVRGDGDLMDARTAARQPIQMLLSGPAASAIGAIECARRSARPDVRDFIVLDMGGTTTDIASVAGGAFQIASGGGSIEGYRTMVRTADVHTFGLGGDSFVDFASSPLSIGPDRVVPIAALPQYTPAWRERIERADGISPCFIVPGERFESPAIYRDIFLEHLEDVGAENWENMLAISPDREYAEGVLAAHERAGRIRRCAFTPTDALVVLGECRIENAEPARMAAKKIANALQSPEVDTPTSLAALVRSRVSASLAQKIFRFLMLREGFSPDFVDGDDGKLLLDIVSGEKNGTLALLPNVRLPIVCLGAPAPAFTRNLEELTGTTCLTFEHGAVGGAIGAALARKHASYRVWVQYLQDVGRYRAHLPDGIADFGDLKAAVDTVREKMEKHISRMSHISGDSPAIQCERIDRVIRIGPRAADARTLYFGTELLFSVER